MPLPCNTTALEYRERRPLDQVWYCFTTGDWPTASRTSRFQQIYSFVNCSLSIWVFDEYDRVGYDFSDVISFSIYFFDNFLVIVYDT